VLQSSVASMGVVTLMIYVPTIVRVASNREAVMREADPEK